MLRRRSASNEVSEKRGRAGGPGRDGSEQPADDGQAPNPEPFTYIQRGTTIVGQLEARGRVRVHGVVKGDVRVDGPLEVAEAGLVEGARIEAEDVKIIGRVVVERLVARGKVEIWDGGELIGDVTAATLDIEEGARFTGRSEMASHEGLAPGDEASSAAGAAALDDAVVASAADALLGSNQPEEPTKRL